VAYTDANGIAVVDLITSYAPGDNFRVVASTTLANAEAVTPEQLTTNAPYSANGVVATPQLSIWRRLHIEQDWMATAQGDPPRTGNILFAAPVSNGRQEIVTSINIGTANEYEHGVFRANGVNYEVVSNTINSNSRITVKTTTPVGYGQFTVYQDDWVDTFAALGNAVPTTVVNTVNTGDLYRFLQPSTNRTLNRFADAYIQPELDSLNQFDSAISAQTHVEATTSSRPIHDLVGGQYGQPRPETHLFWTVYVSSAFEGPVGADADGENVVVLGQTSGFTIQDAISLMYLESMRDAHRERGFSLSLSDYRGLTTVHEVAHHFFERDLSSSDHRDDTLNIMSSEFATTVVNGQTQTFDAPSSILFFDSRDIRTLRNKWRSP
jgi:hypothetical protein